MTYLIEKQINIIIVMAICGMTTGLVLDVFKLFYLRFFKGKKGTRILIGNITAIVTAFLISEYSYYCQNGKISVCGVIAFFVGLFLWYKYFYDIILMGENNEQKREKTP